MKIYAQEVRQTLTAFSFYHSNGNLVFKPGRYYKPEFINKCINNPPKKPINSWQMDFTTIPTTTKKSCLKSAL